ncbi:TolC family protein, partial [Paenibacillus sp. 28ISP30-2]|nr:TolC family protein [Paenibacillus sp. 28ISP30-2]
MKQKVAATLLVLTMSSGLISTVQADSAAGSSTGNTSASISGTSSAAVISKTASVTGQALPPLTLKQAAEWAQTNSYNTRTAERDVERRRIEFK